mmetsp:Transcript_49742/g.95076  ORF Transcript_49742/g.95076 Transcript_49742/m.95076 type:complete len:282 (-) Transcript_49742:2447-3292(-)
MKPQSPARKDPDRQRALGDAHERESQKGGHLPLIHLARIQRVVVNSTEDDCHHQHHNHVRHDAHQNDRGVGVLDEDVARDGEETLGRDKWQLPGGCRSGLARKRPRADGRGLLQRLHLHVRVRFEAQAAHFIVHLHNRLVSDKGRRLRHRSILWDLLHHSQHLLVRGPTQAVQHEIRRVATLRELFARRLREGQGGLVGRSTVEDLARGHQDNHVHIQKNAEAGLVDGGHHGAASPRQLVQPAGDVLRHAGVQAARGLVQKYHSRVLEHGNPDGHAAALPS